MKLKRNLKCILIFLIFISILPGCSGRSYLPVSREINELSLIRVMGVDTGREDPENILVTVTNSAIESLEGKTEPPLILCREGDTVSGAMAHIQTLTDKYIFLGHLDQYIVGGDAASENLIKYVDYLSRDASARTSTNIYIVKNGTAFDLITKLDTKGGSLTDYLAALEKDGLGMSLSSALSVSDMLSRISTDKCALIPAITLMPHTPYDGAVKPEEDSGSGEGASGEDMKGQEKLAMKLDGYAVFKEGKAVGFIDEDEAKGVNTILDKIKSDIIEISDENGYKTAVRIISSECGIKPEFSGDGKLSKVILKIRIFSGVTETTIPGDSMADEIVENLAYKESEVVKDRVRRALEKSQELDADFIGIARRVELSEPYKWHEIKDDWDDIYGNIDFEVEAEALIDRTYNLKQISN